MSGPSPSPGHETAVLLDRVRAGSPDAWPALLDRFHQPLRLYVRARLGRALAARVDVDDVVQETWLRALAGGAGSGVEAFRPEGPGAFRRWLATLARHVLADAARAARAAKRSAREVPLDAARWSRTGLRRGDVADDTAGPATRAARSERARRLEEAFESLPAAQRRLLALRQFEGLPARAVAARLGLTEGAVHARYRRALTAWGAAFDRLT